MRGSRRRDRATGGALGAFLLALLTAIPMPTAAETPDRPAGDLPAGAALAQQMIRIGYLSRATEDTRPAVYGLPPGLSDVGAQGARLGLDDGNSTGRFTGQRFELSETLLAEGQDAGDAVSAFAATGRTLIVADLPAADLEHALAATEAARMLIFNAGAPDDRFRGADCRTYLLHTIPSRAMLADALAQYLVRKRWTKWLLVTGKRPGDALYAEAIRRSAGIFGDLFLYRTWDPRPVAGTQGLTPGGWHPRLEQWGAAQLQSRFFRKAGRPMTSRDYAVWAAVRSIGEAATRSRSSAQDAIVAYVRGEAFELAAFKGRKLSYRAWDGQLRQPIPVGWSEAVVSVSPQDGFLHRSSELDTLGFDAPESACRRG